MKNPTMLSEHCSSRIKPGTKRQSENSSKQWGQRETRAGRAKAQQTDRNVTGRAPSLDEKYDLPGKGEACFTESASSIRIHYHMSAAIGTGFCQEVNRNLHNSHPWYFQQELEVPRNPGWLCCVPEISLTAGRLLFATESVFPHNIYEAQHSLTVGKS